MAWSYTLSVSLDEEQQANRRRLLDAYGQFAQLSVLLLPLVYQLALATRLIVERCFKQNRPGSVKDHSSPLPWARKKKLAPSNKELWLWLE